MAENYPSTPFESSKDPAISDEVKAGLRRIGFDTALNSQQSLFISLQVIRNHLQPIVTAISIENRHSSTGTYPVDQLLKIMNDGHAVDMYSLTIGDAKIVCDGYNRGGQNCRMTFAQPHNYPLSVYFNAYTPEQLASYYKR